jgi:uncharacterized protein Yka (UPF0111/DUF47 family)
VAFNFLPRDEQYFVLFESAARNITAGAEILQDMILHFTDVEAKADRVRAVEQAGDEITFQIISRLGKSFITPIEREDIFAIARRLDDIVDFMDGSAARLASYAIEKPTPAAAEFARLILQSARDLEVFMSQLHRKDVDQIRQPKMAINRYEAEADRLLRRTVAELFTGGADALTVMKWKEIYETLEEVTDRFESLVNVIEGIIVKNT